MPQPDGYDHTDEPVRRGAAVLAAVALCFVLTACTSESKGDDSKTEEAAGVVSVTYTDAERRTVEDVESSIAILRAKRTPSLAAEIEGSLVDVRVDEGDAVDEGEVLAVLNRSDYEIQHRSAEADMRRIEVQVEQKDRDVARQRQLRENGHIPQLVFEEAEAELAALTQEYAAARATFEGAEHDLDRTEVLAPYDGVIAKRSVSEGDFVESGTPLFDMTTNGIAQVRIPVPESVAAELERDQEVRLYRSDRRDEVRIAHIHRVGAEVDLESRAVTAIAELQPVPERWIPGTSVNAEVILESRDSVVVAPGSVVRRPDGLVVFVIDDSVARERQVEVGRRAADWIEILEGVDEGERVVVDGAGFLGDGSRVEAQRHADISASSAQDDAASEL